MVQITYEDAIMKNCACPIIIGLFILSALIPGVLAESDNTSGVENLTIPTTPDTKGNTSAKNPEPEMNNLSISLMKEPKTGLIFAEGTNKTDISNNENKSDEIEVNATGTVDEETTGTTRYNSLGDIIQAQDWKALSEYKCRMKTENPSFFEDSNITMSDKQAKWDNYFKGAPDPVVFPSCCG